MKRTLIDIIRDVVVLAMAVVLMIALSGWLVASNAMSEDNPKDTVVWIVIGLASLVSVFAAVFVFEALILAPYRIWKELKAAVPASLPPPMPQAVGAELPTAPLRPSQISQYEAGRKLSLIDAGFDLLKEATPLIEMGEALHSAPWHQFRMDPERKYPTLIWNYADELRSFAEKVDALRNENQEHQDFMGALQQIYYNETARKIVEYGTACQSVSDVAGDGSKEQLLGLLKPTHDAFGAAIGEFTAWRNKARGTLGDLRKQVASV